MDGLSRPPLKSRTSTVEFFYTIAQLEALSMTVDHIGGEPDTARPYPQPSIPIHNLWLAESDF